MVDLPKSEPSNPIACTLGTDDVPVRLREWQGVLEQVEERRATEHGMRVRFPADPELLAAVAAVATREVECCSFFSFTLTLDANGAWLAITAPTEAESLVVQLFGPIDLPND